MKEQFERTALLLGEEAVDKLSRSRVAVFGIGGVGSFAAEALARAGVGALYLCDSDTVSASNINRQLIALNSTLGEKKVEVMAKRIADINPEAKVVTLPLFFSAETLGEFDFSLFDYAVDAIDTVTSKLLLIETAKAAGVPIISCMGAGNKLDPTRFEVADIKKTSVCPLAKVMRRELKARGIDSLKVVFSTEEAKKPTVAAASDLPRKITPGSVSFVPSAAGLILAGEVIKNLID